jgi:probable HAF family extracellular repeat protein
MRAMSSDSTCAVNATAKGVPGMNIKFSMLAVVVALCAAGADEAGAVTRYRVTDLGSDLFPLAINASGQVTGVTLPDPRRAFLYSGGVVQELGTLGGESSAGRALNDHGEVTGTAWADTGRVAFLYSNGSMQDLGAGDFSQGNGINNSGHITGQAITAEGERQAFIYSGGGLHFLDGTLYGTDINASGQVTGVALRPIAGSPDEMAYGFLYSGGSIQDLGTLGGGRSSVGVAINDRGQVTGNAQTAQGMNHAFLYSDGSMRDLGEGEGEGINNYGWVVGRLLSGHAFVYDGTARYDLNNFLDGSGAGWRLRGAMDINDAGQIIGRGTHDGVDRGYLLTPVPEPEAYALMLCGLGLLALRRKVAQRHPQPASHLLCTGGARAAAQATPESSSNGRR